MSIDYDMRAQALSLALTMGGASPEIVVRNASAFLAFLTGGAEAGAAPAADPPRRGRPPKATTATLGADALVPDSRGDTDAPAPASTEPAPAAAPAGASMVVDAGTGKPVVQADPADARKEAKTQAALLMAKDTGALTVLLRKHSGIAEGAVKFGNVPDAAIPAFVADIQAALAGGAALDD